MILVRKALFVLLLVLLCAMRSYADTPAKVYTSVFPPIVTDQPHLPGYAYEIVEALFAIAKIEAEIIQLPWARAQKVAQSTPEAVIFPLTRTPTREVKFQWSFILFKTQTHFVTLNEEKLTKESAKSKLIGVQRGSSWDNWLTENQYPNVHRTTNEGHALVRMLKAKRIDTWYAEKSVAQNILPMNKVFDATFSEPVLSFKTYLATNKQVPFRHMDKLEAAFEKLVASGEYAKIMERYSIRADQVQPD